MSEHPNAARIRALFAAFRAGDIATIQDSIAENAVWHFPGTRGEARGIAPGHAGIFAFLARCPSSPTALFTSISRQCSRTTRTRRRSSEGMESETDASSTTRPASRSGSKAGAPSRSMSSSGISSRSTRSGPREGGRMAAVVTIALRDSGPDQSGPGRGRHLGGPHRAPLRNPQRGSEPADPLAAPGGAPGNPGRAS